VTNFYAVISLKLNWINAKESTTTNPSMLRESTPPHFGPGFKLPHELDLTFRLTEMPTTQGGWATGCEPGIEVDATSKLAELLNIEIAKLDWIQIPR
jgi:hypothetical protein